MGVRPILDVAHMPLACRHCSIRSRSLCGVLAAEELHALNNTSAHRSFAEGQIIVTEGEPDVFANVVGGIVAEKKTLQDGREQIVSLLFPGDFMGNAFGGAAGVSVEAASRVTLCMFDPARFERAVGTYPTLQNSLLQHTQAQLRDARDWLLLLGQKTAMERVATFMSRLADRAVSTHCHHVSLEQEDVTFEMPITRAQMAAFLGITIETVSRKLTQLRKAGIIEIVDVRSVRILNRARLEDASG